MDPHQFFKNYIMLAHERARELSSQLPAPPSYHQQLQLHPLDQYRQRYQSNSSLASSTGSNLLGGGAGGAGSGACISSPVPSTFPPSARLSPYEFLWSRAGGGGGGAASAELARSLAGAGLSTAASSPVSGASSGATLRGSMGQLAALSQQLAGQAFLSQQQQQQGPFGGLAAASAASYLTSLAGASGSGASVAAAAAAAAATLAAQAEQSSAAKAQESAAQANTQAAYEALFQQYQMLLLQSAIANYSQQMPQTGGAQNRSESSMSAFNSTRDSSYLNQQDPIGQTRNVHSSNSSRSGASKRSSGALANNNFYLNELIRNSSSLLPQTVASTAAHASSNPIFPTPQAPPNSKTNPTATLPNRKEASSNLQAFRRSSSACEQAGSVGHSAADFFSGADKRHKNQHREPGPLTESNQQLKRHLRPNQQSSKSGHPTLKRSASGLALGPGSKGASGSSSSSSSSAAASSDRRANSNRCALELGPSAGPTSGRSSEPLLADALGQLAARSQQPLQRADADRYQLAGRPLIGQSQSQGQQQLQAAGRQAYGGQLADSRDNGDEDDEDDDDAGEEEEVEEEEEEEEGENSNDNEEEEEEDCEPAEKCCKWSECSMNGQHFANLKELVDHVEYHCDSNKKTFACFWHDCTRDQKPFKALYMLKVHMRRHTGYKPHRCEIILSNGNRCDKAYSRVENLKTHLRSHSGEKPYPCQFEGCSKAFSNASDRAKHQNRTHSKEKPYICWAFPECQKAYTDPSSLRKHIKTVHGTDYYTETKRKRNASRRQNNANMSSLISSNLEGSDNSNNQANFNLQQRESGKPTKMEQSMGSAANSIGAQYIGSRATTNGRSDAHLTRYHAPHLHDTSSNTRSNSNSPLPMDSNNNQIGYESISRNGSGSMMQQQAPHLQAITAGPSSSFSHSPSSSSNNNSPPINNAQLQRNTTNYPTIGDQLQSTSLSNSPHDSTGGGCGSQYVNTASANLLFHSDPNRNEYFSPTSTNNSMSGYSNSEPPPAASQQFATNEQQNYMQTGNHFLDYNSRSSIENSYQQQQQQQQQGSQQQSQAHDLYEFSQIGDDPTDRLNNQHSLQGLAGAPATNARTNLRNKQLPRHLRETNNLILSPAPITNTNPCPPPMNIFNSLGASGYHGENQISAPSLVGQHQQPFHQPHFGAIDQRACYPTMPPTTSNLSHLQENSNMSLWFQNAAVASQAEYSQCNN